MFMIGEERTNKSDRKWQHTSWSFLTEDSMILGSEVYSNIIKFYFSKGILLHVKWTQK